MTRIKATCPACGEVSLRPTEIELQIVRGTETEVARGSCYRFSCPACTDLVTKPADERIARLLTGGGVPVVVASTGRRSTGHPEAPPAGPPLTHDDLLDLHQLLEQPAWFRALEAMTR